MVQIIPVVNITTRRRQYTMKKLKRKTNPLQLRILMLKKGVRSSDLQKIFKIKRAAVSMAVSGRRPSLHFKILEYVRSKSARRAA
jgi:hypothetical protein